METQTLKDQAYVDLINDLKEKLLDKDVWGKSKAKQHQNFTGNLTKCIGRKSNISARSIEDYWSYSEFKPKNYFINDLSAAWLNLKGKVPEAEIKAYFEKMPKTSLDFWYIYLREYKKIGEGSTVPEPVWETEDYDGNEFPDGWFLLPDPTGYEPRTDQIQTFLTTCKVNEHTLLIVESLPYMGTSLFLKCFAKCALDDKEYDQVLWKTIEPGYSFKFFLNEFDVKNIKATNSLFAQGTKMLNTLNAKNLLLIFDGFENADHQSFEYFLKTIAEWDGTTRIILSSNQPKIYDFIPLQNIYLLSPYTFDEFVLVAREMGIIKLEINILHEIYVKTEGLPYYVDLILKRIRFDSYQMDLDQMFREMDASKDFQDWVNALLKRINLKESLILNALSVLNEDFTTETIEYFANAVNIQDSKTIVSKLKKEGLIKSKGTGLYEVLIVVRNYFLTEERHPVNAEFHRMAADYHWPSGEAYTRGHDYTDLLNIKKAIVHFQKAGLFTKSDLYLNSVIPHLKRHGFYEMLEELLKNNIDHNAAYDRWYDFHYAYWGLVTGHLQQGHYHIKLCINKALANLQENREQDNINFFVKAFQLYSEYISRLISVNAALDILSQALAVFEPKELSWDVRIQAISTLSWYYMKLEDRDKGMEINYNILHDCLVNTDQTKAVSLTRIGIIQIEQQEFEKAEISLTEAANLFGRHVDKRGMVWCYTHLTKCDHHLNHIPQIALFKDILGINKEGDLFDPDYQHWITFFKGKLVSAEINALFKSEENRINKKIMDIEKIMPRLSLITAADEVSQQLLALEKKPFSYKNYVHPFESNAIPINSIAADTYLNKVARIPVIYFNDLFSRKTIKQIFSYHLFNRALADCMHHPKYGISVFKKFVEPNFDRVKSSTDSIKLHYAYALQHIGEISKSLELLYLVRPKNRQVKYHRIKGNCYYSLGNFYKSYAEYQLALQHKDATVIEKGGLNNNIARLIWEAKETGRYREALKCCTKAIASLPDKDQKRFPIKTLFLLTTETSHPKYLIESLQKIIAEHQIKIEELLLFIEEIENQKKAYFIKKNTLPFHHASAPQVHN